MESRESLKNVSLGTSKINYLDPRCVPRAALAAAWYRCAEGRPPCPARSISVAWCKKHEVPIEKIYTKVLLEKFGVRFTRAALAFARRGTNGSGPTAVVHGD